MELKLKDIVDKHKDEMCFIACHGPSLEKYKDAVQGMQASNKAIRLSTNNWFDFFESKPDYWILSNTEFTIESRIFQLNRFKVPVFYADSADLTDNRFIEKNLKCDYLAYDQRHFKNKTCREIFLDFKKHHTENSNFEFKDYGNNDVMWQPPRCLDGAGFSGVLSHGVGRNGRCCKKIQPGRKTIHEFLQKISGHEEHCSTGDTVAIEMISFAIIMGCNPIYVTGMDLDYNLGYANGEEASPNQLSADDWGRLNKNLVNDLRILNESAIKRGIKIINLNEEAWYDEFEKGVL